MRARVIADRCYINQSVCVDRTAANERQRSGRSDLWHGLDERDLPLTMDPLTMDAELPVAEIRLDAAVDVDEAHAFVQQAGLVLPAGTVFGEKYHSWRAFLP